MSRAKLIGSAGSGAIMALSVGGLTLLDGGTNPAAAWLCTYKTEVTSGINKICIYHCPTGDAAITISVASICPISINQ